MKSDYYGSICKFFLMIRKNPNFLNKAHKKKICEIIVRLKNITNEDKRKFILYYGLEENKAPLTYTKIEKIENCSHDQLKRGIAKVLNRLTKVNAEERIYLLLLYQLLDDYIYPKYYFNSNSYKNMCNYIEKARKRELKVDEIKQLYDMLVKTKRLTDKQRKRFMLYYGLENDEKMLDYKEISQRDNCSISAVRGSILRAKCIFARYLVNERFLEK